MKTVLRIVTLLTVMVLLCAPAYASEPEKADTKQQTAQAASGGSDGEKSEISTAGERNAVSEERAEEQKGFSAGTDMAFFSKYVSRGMTTNDDPVFEPNFWMAYKGITFSVWGNMDLTNHGGMSGNFNEVDYTLDYTGDFNKIDYSVGAIYYTFPHTGADDTSEVYAGLGYDVFLHPKLVVYYDFWQVDGLYGNFSISHGFEFPEIKGIKSSLDLSAQVGMGSKNFNEFNFGCSHTAFTDMVLTASLPVAISDHFTVKPTISYSSALDRTIRTKNFKNDNIILGAVLSASL